MTGFEFSLIPVAIIVGFALTRILSCWGQVVRQWSELEKPWLFLSFTVIAMAGMLSHFVGDWAYRDVELHFGQLVLIILPTLAMVLAVSVILPSGDDLPLDLDEYYFSYATKAASLFVIGVLLSVIPDLFPGAVNVPELWMVGAVVVPLVCIATFRRPVIHLVSHGVMWVIMLVQMSSLTSFGSIQ